MIRAPPFRGRAFISIKTATTESRPSMHCGFINELAQIAIGAGEQAADEALAHVPQSKETGSIDVEQVVSNPAIDRPKLASFDRDSAFHVQPSVDPPSGEEDKSLDEQAVDQLLTHEFREGLR